MGVDEAGRVPYEGPRPAMRIGAEAHNGEDKGCSRGAGVAMMDGISSDTDSVRTLRGSERMGSMGGITGMSAIGRNPTETPTYPKPMSPWSAPTGE